VTCTPDRSGMMGKVYLILARGDDLAVVLRIVWTCILRTSPRRAFLTLSMCLETACRRPRAIRHAFTLALMHKHFLRVRAEDLEGPGRADPGATAGGASSLTDAAYLVRDSSGGLAMRALRGLGVLVLAVVLASAWGCGSTAKTEGTGEYVDDSVITSKVKAAIFNDPNLKVNEINVETFKGVVQLSGFVRSQADIDQAVKVAGGIAGVKSVKNDMRLK
jgi:hypothetical protein